MLIMITLVVFVLLFFNLESKDLSIQELNSQEAAEKYLISISEQSHEEDLSTELLEDGQVFSSDFDYEDGRIYSYYKEEWAEGYIDAVLEIPKIDLRQSIFTGTVEQINHDLDCWLPVTARADYVLGDTHYCVYIHNPRDKSIQISKAQYELTGGDYMILTKDSSVYFYVIDDVYAEWRNKCTDDIVNNMSVAADKLYIFTCGRDDWQGRNLVIEGTMAEVYDVSDWGLNRDRYISEYTSQDDGEIVQKNKDLVLDVSLIDSDIIVSVRSEDYTKLENCKLGIFNADGYLIDNNIINWEGSPITLNSLDPGEYYIGVYECGEHNIPAPYKVTITEDSSTEVQDVAEVNYNESKSLIVVKIVAIIMFISSLITGIMLIFKKND